MSRKALTFDWGREPAEYVDADTMNQKIAEVKKLEEKGKLTKIPFYIQKNYLKLTRTYCLQHDKHSSVLRVFINCDKHYQYMFNENRGTSVSCHPEITGMQAYNYIEEIFQDRYGEDKTLFKAFSGIAFKTEYFSIKHCVPKPVSFINNFYREAIVKGIRKADICSAYPTEGSKILPTLHQCKKVKGYAEPTEEYPFAFYINSHHMAIYNEFKTQNWFKDRKYYPLYDEMFNDSITDEDEVTILCKKSTYYLSSVFTEVFDRKQEGDPVAKLGMNAAIGMFQKTNNPRLSHLAAVIIGRCANRIITTARSIEKQNGIVLLIATDSIIWKGGEIKEAVDYKALGTFTYEVHNGQFYGAGSKAYQLIDDNGVVITKYSGMKNTEEKNKIDFGKIPSKTTSRRYIIEDDGTITELNCFM